MRGGSWLLVSSCSVANVVSTVLIFSPKASAMRKSKRAEAVWAEPTDLSIDKLEYKSDFVPLYVLRLDLRREPTLRVIKLPGSGPDIIGVSHIASKRGSRRMVSITGLGERSGLAPAGRGSTAISVSG